LLESVDEGGRRRLSFSKWRKLLVVGIILTATVLYFLSISWSLDPGKTLE